MIYIEKIELLENNFGENVNHHPLSPFQIYPLNINEINKAAKKIGDFIGLNNYIFVVNHKRLDANTGAHIELQNEERYVFIEISEQLNNEYSILAALAHELSHKFLHIKGFYLGVNAHNEYQNEIFTDITAVYLGLGKLMLNGSEVKINDENYSRTQQIGYLNRDQLAYVYYIICKMRDIPLSEYQQELTLDAKNAILNWFNRDFDESHKQCILGLKNICEFYKERKSLIFKSVRIEERLNAAKSDLHILPFRMSPLEKNQERLNRTHWFWDVSVKDDTLMAEYTIANYFGNHGLTFSRIEESLNELASRHKALVNELRIVKKERGLLFPLDKEIATINKDLLLVEEKIASISSQFDAVSNLHSKYFSQINLVRTECADILCQIDKCKKILGDILTAHQYYLENPQVWDNYQKDEVMQEKIQILIESGEYQTELSIINDWVQATEQLLGSLRIADPENFPKTTCLSTIRSRLQVEHDGFAKKLEYLSALRTSQQIPAAHYLKKAQLLLNNLKEVNEVIKEEQRVLDLIRKRQKWIFDHHQWLEIDRNDEQEFSAITEAIYTCTYEADLSRIHGITEKIEQDVRSNIERVQALKDSGRVKGIDTFEKEYQQTVNELQEVKERISKWRALQEKYHRKWKETQERSISYQMGKVVKGINNLIGKPIQTQKTDTPKVLKKKR